MIKGWKNSLIFAAIFLFYIVIWGFYFNFFVPVWLAMFLVLLVAFVSSYLLLRDLIWSLILSLIVFEIAWSIIFLPLNYLTLAAILILIHYLCWDFLVFKINKKRLIANLVFGLICLLILLLSSKWLPV